MKDMWLATLLVFTEGCAGGITPDDSLSEAEVRAPGEYLDLCVSTDQQPVSSQDAQVPVFSFSGIVKASSSHFILAWDRAFRPSVLGL